MLENLPFEVYNGRKCGWRLLMRIKKVLLTLTAIILLSALFVPGGSKAAQEEEFRAVWVATVMNLDFPSRPGISVDQLRRETDEILDNIADMGYNAVILQVRPTADAFYRSSIFPWSHYLTGTQGTPPAGGFDPLDYWVKQAHARGLELHAWINPFRVTQGTPANRQHDLSRLAVNNPARRNPSWTVAHSDGRLYFNPGIPEVRRLIIDGVVEIVRNYDVDGIHFDDYFYPDPNFNDAAAFSRFGSGFSSRAEWRRDNVNKLIQETHRAVKAENPNVQFGVSPFAIWANRSTNALGSDTNGFQSYVSQFADSRRWVKNNWVDYIAPQIYWNIGFAAADYAKLLPWWADVVRGTDVKLYIGKGLYRVDDARSAESVWYDGREITRQAELNAQYPEVAGVIHFRYSNLRNNAVKEAVSMVFDSQTAGLPSPVPIADEFRMPQIQLGRLTVGRPTSSNLTTSEPAYYILGTCDPNRKLFVNGREVADISPEGYFGFHASLSVGANNFRFTQEGQAPVTITITRRTAAVTPASPMSTVDIVAGSVFPRTTDELRRPGETVTLSCIAPIGATVRVTIGNRTFNMTPATRTPPGRGAFPTTYTHQFTFPATTVTGRLVTIGTPRYTMTYNGRTYTRDAGGALISITPEAPFYATVTSDNAYLFPNGSTTGGPKAELVKGQRDYVTAVASNGDWVRLAVGGWVQGSDVSLNRNESAALRSEISSASYTVGEKVDTLSLTARNITATDISFDGTVLVYTVSNTPSAPRVTLPSNAIIADISSFVRNGATVYTMTVGDRFDGYYLTASGDTLTLNLKRRPRLQTGDKPLAGINILLDPGHGGTDTGAIGPLGARLAEKHINLAFAYKLKAILESQGATVNLSRAGDTLPSLNDRVELSRRLRPDLFVSIHANSVSESTNSSNIRGFESFFRNNVGKGISDLLVSTVQTNPLYGRRSSRQSNFFVLRPTWTPSALIESGFIPNVGDFSRLTNEDEQYKLASLLASAIIKYFE
jgi:uncharacterized lipoprotein YddW (UPF0748 family)/N-acetylmuramoyl-L-alanine amidase